MAEIAHENVGEKEETKKKSLLEEKSKEDLIKIVAKQLNLLKKAKGKSDDLGKRCEVLEVEKQAALEKHSTTIVELQLHIDKLEKENYDLSEKRNKVIEEKNNELSHLKGLLKTLESDKISITSLLNEKEEQIQCLTMQLTTVKETCQFLQAENLEHKSEIRILTEARNSTVESLKSLTLNSESKSREYENIVKNMNELKKEFEVCKKENASLAYKVTNLTGQIEALQIENSDFALKLKNSSTSNKPDSIYPVGDLAFLVMDNQKLLSENSELKEKLKELENGSPYHGDDLSDIVCTQEKCLNIQKENTELYQNLCTLKGENEKLKDESHGLTEKLEGMKFVKLELDGCLKEKENLNNEIKRLANLLHQNEEFKSGFEHALLYGAGSEHLNQSPLVSSNSTVEPTEPLSTSYTLPESSQPNERVDIPVLDQLVIPILDNIDIPAIDNIDMDMMAGGLELGFLCGGAMIEPFPTVSFEPATNTPETELNEKEVEKLLAKNAELLHEIDRVRIKNDEFSSFLQETLVENESLKLKLESMENEKLLKTSQKALIDADTNTEIPPCDPLERDLENEKLSNEIARLSAENREYHEKCSNFVSEIEFMKREAGHSSEKLGVLEKHNFELNEKFEKKSLELEELNFQLELLIISIKQGVRQKSSGTLKKSEKPLHENLALIKNLLDDLIIKSNDNVIKTKSLESNLEELMVQKEAAEYDIQQLKELNQFLEDEASELRLEIEQLKSTRELNEEKYSLYERGMKSSSELYSIDEIDEKVYQEEKSEQSDTETEIITVKPGESSEIPFADFSVQVNIQSSDSYKNKLDSPVNEENELVDSDQKSKFEATIKNLSSEISDLKSCLADKTSLVEKIHCQLDAHLEQIETLNSELKEKEDDLKNSQGLVSALQEQILQFENKSILLKEGFKKATGQILKLKAERNRLSSSILSLTTLSEETESIKNNLPSVINEYIKSIKLDCNNCSHLVKVNSYVKNYLCSSFSAMEKLIKSMQLMDNSSSAMSDILDLLESYRNDENLDHCALENKCSNDCCTLAVDVDNIKVLKNEFATLLHNFLNNISKNSSVKLSEYEEKLIPSLRATIADLENQLQESSNKNISLTDSISEQKLEISTCETSSDDIKSQLADKEVKMNKFKQIALKLKKELLECKKKNSELQKEIENLSTEQLQYVQNYQSLQNEYDKIQDELEFHKENAKKLEGDFSSTLHGHNYLKEKVAELESQLLKSKQMLDAITLDKQEKEKWNVDLEGKLIVAESKIQEKTLKIEELETIIKAKTDNVNAVAEENDHLKKQLEISQKEEKKKDLMDLEMADYERSVEELNIKIQKKEEEITELKLKLTSESEKNEGLLEEIRSTETLKETEEKRIMNLKEVLEKTKSELSVVREREEELETTVSSLKIQLEILVQQEENCKLQLSETSSEIQHLKEMLKTSSENHQRIVRSFESKISTQKQEILLSHKEVENIKQEFENYKIRVHSVLKQQKSTTPTFASMEEDLTEKLESVIEKLKLQVKDLNEKLTAVSLEYEGLQEEHDVLVQRYNKAISDREKEENEWHSRLQQLNLEKSKMRTAQEELSSQHLLQNEMLVSTYKKQIKIMSEEHKRTVNDLQKQLESADMEIARLQRDQQKAHGLPVTPTMQETMSFDILSQERPELEGSESIDDSDTSVRHFSLSTIPSSGFLPLEKLLQSPLEGNTPRNSLQYQDCEKLVSDLNASNKQIEHLSEVLNESESANLRLSEQVRVLKEEVRRLERNKEREEHAENLEYLKNVFIKFSTLNACREKAMLIPVLTTMLKLSPSEQQQLKSIAGDMDPNDAANSGWGSYLHRWSGLA